MVVDVRPVAFDSSGTTTDANVAVVTDPTGIVAVAVDSKGTPADADIADTQTEQAVGAGSSVHC